MRRLGWCTALACSLLVAASSAGAQPTPADLDTARKLFAEAEKHEKAQHWQQALATLQDVASIKETPGVRFHIGNCLDHLGRLVEALRSFERARSLAQQSETRDVLQLAGPRIEQLQARIPTLTVSVTGSGPRPVVRVDGAPMGPEVVGTPVAFDPGSHTVVAHFPGAPPVVRLVALVEGQPLSVQIASPLPVAPARKTAAQPSSPPQAERADDTSNRVPIAAWVLMGAGVGMGVGGVLAFRQAASVAQDSQSACARSVACDPERVEVVRRYDGVALSLWAGAALCTGAGVVWAIRASSARPAASVALYPDRLVLRGSF